MTSPAELAIQKQITKAFINTRPVTLILTPYARVSDGSGGRKLTPGQPRSPQVLRFVESASIRADLRSTDLGEQVQQDATLLGMPDAAIEVNDRFTWSGSEWTVTEISFPNEWEVRATVVRYGTQ